MESILTHTRFVIKQNYDLYKMINDGDMVL